MAASEVKFTPNPVDNGWCSGCHYFSLYNHVFSCGVGFFNDHLLMDLRRPIECQEKYNEGLHA